MEIPQKIKKLEVPAIPLLDIYLKEMNSSPKEVSAPTCSLKHLSQQSQHGNNLGVHCGLMNTQSAIHAIKCYSATRKKQVLPFEMMWVDCEAIVLSKTSQRKTNTE